MKSSLACYSVCLAARGRSPDRLNACPTGLASLLMLRGGTGGFACRSGCTGLQPRAASQIRACVCVGSEKRIEKEGELLNEREQPSRFRAVNQHGRINECAEHEHCQSACDSGE